MKDNWESYFIDGTTTLKNKFDLIDKNELSKLERRITLEKLVFLYLEPIKGNFDAEHLKKIHSYLFNDIYFFAGQYRTVNITTFDNAFFEFYPNIKSRLEYTLNQMNNEIQNLSSYYYHEFLADFYYELIKTHPFREGNGRSIREFLREFVLEKIPNYELDFEKFDRTTMIDGLKMRVFSPYILNNEFKKALVLKK